MKDAYRDERVVLDDRARQLELDLSKRDEEIEELRKRLAEQDAVLGRLHGVLAGRPQPRWRSVRWAVPVISGVTFVAAAAVGVATLGVRSRQAAAAPASLRSVAKPGVSLNEGSVPPPTVPAAPVEPLADVCDRLGVRLTVDGDDAEAPAAGNGDKAGHSYRRGGKRAAWFTVQGGNLYVHGVGDFLRGDLGKSRLTLFDVVTKGETGGYTLARGGKALLEVTRSDGERVAGRFEADMSRVDDVTGVPPFGTPVVRVRGNFCLPAFPDDPNDTGP